MVRVALVVPPKKRDQLAKRGFFDKGNHGVEYIGITSQDDLQALLASPPDLVISKIYEETPKTILEYIESVGPKVHPITESMQSVFRDRYEIIQTIWKGKKAESPDSALIDSPVVDDYLIEAFLTEHEHVIVKPRLASGPSYSHNMCISSSLRVVKEFASRNYPVIVQQFVPHNGLFVKAFVIGEHVSLFARQSVKESQMDSEINSQGLFKDGDSDDAFIASRRAELLVMVDELVNLFRVPLLGIDFVVHSDNGQIYVVDVNYFPSYNELGNEFRVAMDALVFSLLPTNGVDL